MPIEQEPIKIVIPVEEEDTPPMRPEGSRPGVTQNLTHTSQQVAQRARSAWESEQRKQAQALAAAGAKRGARLAQSGLVRGLHWLSARLSDLATRLEQPKRPS